MNCILDVGIHPPRCARQLRVGTFKNDASDQQRVRCARAFWRCRALFFISGGVGALKLARQGFYSRATAALSAAQVADASAAANAEAMTRLHPKAPSEPSLLPPPPEQDAAPEFPEAKVIAALRNFSLGSTGGPSRLAPSMILAACKPLGGNCIDETVKMVNRIVKGLIPSSVAPWSCFAVAVRARKTTFNPTTPFTKNSKMTTVGFEPTPQDQSLNLAPHPRPRCLSR